MLANFLDGKPGFGLDAIFRIVATHQIQNLHGVSQAEAVHQKAHIRQIGIVPAKPHAQTFHCEKILRSSHKNLQAGIIQERHEIIFFAEETFYGIIKPIILNPGDSSHFGDGLIDFLFRNEHGIDILRGESGPVG